MEQILSPNFNNRPKDTVINTIIIHFTEVDKQKTIKIFQDQAKEVSSHYLIDKMGAITQFVAPDKRAWHAGVSYWKGNNNLNNNSIGIELENNGKEKFTEMQYASLIEQIKKLKELYPSIKDELILGHSDIAPQRKQDPGKYFKWEVLNKNNIGIYLNRDIKNNNLIAKKGDEGEEVISLQKSLDEFGYDVSIDGIYGKKTQNVVRNFKTHFCRKKIDDIWDEYSSNVIKELLLRSS